MGDYYFVKKNDTAGTFVGQLYGHELEAGVENGTIQREWLCAPNTSGGSYNDLSSMAVPVSWEPVGSLLERLGQGTQAAVAEPVSVEIATGRSEPMYQVELPDGDIVPFASLSEVKAAILAGTISRNAAITGKAVAKSTKKDASGNVLPMTVEDWAIANDSVRPLYQPVWSATMKGLAWGFGSVLVLKFLDTLVTLAQAKGELALLWVLVTAFMVSPKFKPQIALFAFLAVRSDFGILFKAFSMLSSAWLGVLAFAAVFGISGGMAVGTIVGYIRRRASVTAPDAVLEGRKPFIWGLSVPTACFIVAVIAYIKVFVPAVVGMMEHQ